MSAGPTAPEEAQAAPAASFVGQILDGRYRILKLIGEGGMGEVYAAEHVHIEKKFAIKLLKSEIVSNQEAVQRFRQEARSSSSIGHRNIISIDDFGQLPDGRIYMCMELLNGAALNDLILQPQPAARLLDILIQTGAGLAAAHAKGIIHRDMKPENIFVTVGPNGEDVPKILDFGIAKVSHNDGQNHLTRTGTIFGTPFYMAPEQALGNAVDARSDIYSMGVIMYECFSGSLPFQGESFMGILTQHITSEAEPVEQRAAKANRALPPGLAEVIGRCMRKNPVERFAAMDDLVAALVAIYRGLAGPGMSSYMPAFTAGGAPHVAQPTPSPHGYAAPPTGPYAAPPTGPYAAPRATPPTGPHAAPAVAAKSKAGMMIGIVAVIAVGGAIGAFVVLGNKGESKGTGAGSGAAIAEVGSGSAAIAEPRATPDAAIAEHHADAAIAQPSGSGAIAAAGSGNLPAIDVMLDIPPKAQIFDEVGALVSADDYIAHIAPGSPRTFTIKQHGYRDKVLTVDGTQKVYRITLDPVAVAHPPITTPAPHDRDPIPAHGHEPTHPKVDCSKRVVDPRDENCQRQYCSLHGTDPVCSMDD